MNEPAIDELKAIITDVTNMMSSGQVIELAKDIQSFFDDIGLLKLEQDKQINEIVEILSKDGSSVDKAHIAKFVLEVKNQNTIKQAKTIKKKIEAEQKYVHPDHEEETWSGRGPKPPKIWQDLIDKEKAKAGNESKKRNELLKPYLIKKE